MRGSGFSDGEVAGALSALASGEDACPSAASMEYLVPRCETGVSAVGLDVDGVGLIRALVAEGAELRRELSRAEREARAMKAVVSRLL